jgi:hypothetical protein
VKSLARTRHGGPILNATRSICSVTVVPASSPRRRFSSPSMSYALARVICATGRSATADLYLRTRSPAADSCCPRSGSKLTGSPVGPSQERRLGRIGRQGQRESLHRRLNAKLAEGQGSPLRTLRGHRYRRGARWLLFSATGSPTRAAPGVRSAESSGVFAVESSPSYASNAHCCRHPYAMASSVAAALCGFIQTSPLKFSATS